MSACFRPKPLSMSEANMSKRCLLNYGHAHSFIVQIRNTCLVHLEYWSKAIQFDPCASSMHTMQQTKHAVPGLSLLVCYFFFSTDFFFTLPFFSLKFLLLPIFLLSLDSFIRLQICKMGFDFPWFLILYTFRSQQLGWGSQKYLSLSLTVLRLLI